MEVFRCPRCHHPLPGWPPAPRCETCGFNLRVEDGIYLFTDAPVVQMEGKRTYVGYDAIAEGYDRCQHPAELQSQIHAGYGSHVAQQLGRESTLLDLGCGPGRYAVEIAKRGPRVIAGDISREMLRILASRWSGVEDARLIPCRLDAHELPLADGSIDAVLALQLLHFVGAPEIVVGEIRRVLTADGCLITTAPVEQAAPQEPERAPSFGLLRGYYGEELRKAGVDEARYPGWSTREIGDHLDRTFARRRILTGPAMEFRYRVTAGWFLEKLKGRYTLFLMEVPPAIHNRALANVRERLMREFGPEWESLITEYHERHALTVYSKGDESRQRRPFQHPHHSPSGK